MRNLVIFTILSLVLGSQAIGAPADSKLKVGISLLEPFVILESGDKSAGFSVDLWRKVESKLSVKSDFVICQGVEDKLKKLQNGEIDVAIGGITVTGAREKEVDFIHSFYHTGLGIMTKKSEGISIWKGLLSLFSKNKLIIIISFLVLVIVSGHMMWFAERGKDMFNDNYFPGVFEGMYWAIVTASTVGYGDKAPVKWPGRILAGIVIVVSLPMFAIFTAELASTLTLSKFISEIKGPEDLEARPVGVIKGSTSAERMRDYRCRPKNFNKMSEACQALRDGLVDAIVYDAPVLSYYASKSDDLIVLERIFDPQDLAYAVRSGSELREKLNLEILELQRNGEIHRLKNKWFGDI